LLFTDIEGSTRLLQRLGDRYADVLAAHHALLRAVWASHGGVEVDTAGDGFFVVFARVTDAVSATIAAQQTLAAHIKLEGEPLRVRMGLHTGTPVRTDTGYVGLDVHRAARIMSAGHGGQVLLSEASALAARPTLPPDVDLRDLGEHRLKDLPRPERIFQLVTADLPAKFPPLRVPDLFGAHYEAVEKAMVDGRLVLFLGSGVNLCGRSVESRWTPQTTMCLPTDAELAEYLTHRFDYPTSEPLDLVRVAQHIAVTVGTGPLYDELHSVFDADYPLTKLHRFVAGLPRTLRARGVRNPYQLIVSTNYDDAIERAFDEAEEPYDVVSYMAEGGDQGRFIHLLSDGTIHLIDRPNEYLGLSVGQRSVILKIHGFVDRLHAVTDSFVVTEDHYIDYLTRADISNLLPVTIAAKLRRSHYLFLGYRLRDWNLRVILHRIWGQQRLAYKSWAFQGDTQAIDRQFWAKREVEIFKVDLEEVVASLGARLEVRPSLEPAEQ
jgi:class 3 adenylate cyclase